MKIKELFQWQANMFYRGFIVYYGVMLLLNIMFTGITFFVNNDAHYNTANSSLFFLFAMGIVGFTETFKFGIGHGISRKTMLVTTIISCAAMSVAVVIFNTLLGLLSSLLIPSGVAYSIPFSSIYSNYSYGFSGESTISALIMIFICNMAVAIFGYFIGALNHRMSTAIKLVVYIGMPVLLLGVGPATFVLIPKPFQQAITTAFLNVVTFTLASPYNLLLIIAAIAAVLYGASVLLVRRAPLKTI